MDPLFLDCSIPSSNEVPIYPVDEWLEYQTKAYNETLLLLVSNNFLMGIRVRGTGRIVLRQPSSKFVLGTAEYCNYGTRSRERGPNVPQGPNVPEEAGTRTDHMRLSWTSLIVRRSFNLKTRLIYSDLEELPWSFQRKQHSISPIWGILGMSGSVISGQKIQSYFFGFDDVIPDRKFFVS